MRRPRRSWRLGLAPMAMAEPMGATSWMSRTWGLDGRVSELVPTSRGIVGGTFTTAVAPSAPVNGASRRNLAAVRLSTGGLLP